MKRNTKIIAGVLAMVLLFGGAYLLYNKLSEDYAPENSSAQTGKTEVPDFTILNYDGEEVKLTDLRGKPVVINFWATWCTFCKQSLPSFEEVYAEYGEDVHFVMINAGEAIETAKEYIKDKEYTFPVYFDANNEAVTTFSVTGFPVTFLIDEDGNYFGRAMGAIGTDALLDGVEKLLE